jgi:hypothetical protein
MNSHNADDASRDRLLDRIAALLWVVVIALVVTFFHFARSLCLTILLASLLAILDEPASCPLGRVVRSPHGLGGRLWDNFSQCNFLRFLPESGNVP